MADLAALVATAIAAVSSVPQVRRLVVTGDSRGVSVSFATLGLTTEATWTVYALHEGLWAAVPEAALMVVVDATLAVVLIRAGARTRRAVRATALWLAVIVAVAVVGRTGAVAVLLAAGYAVQVAPSVWTAYRTRVPSGLAAATWALVGVEAVLWGTYGLVHGDPATMGFGVLGSAATIAILARKRATRHRLVVRPMPASDSIHAPSTAHAA